MTGEEAEPQPEGQRWDVGQHGGDVVGHGESHTG